MSKSKATKLKLSLKHEVDSKGQNHRIILKAGRAVKATGKWSGIGVPAQLRVTIGDRLRHFVAVHEPDFSSTTEVKELKPVSEESLTITQEPQEPTFEEKFDAGFNAGKEV